MEPSDDRVSLLILYSELVDVYYPMSLKMLGLSGNRCRIFVLYCIYPKENTRQAVATTDTGHDKNIMFTSLQ